MSESRKSKLKVGEVAALVGLSIFIIAMVVGLSMLAWPTIQKNWFPQPTPIVDVRPLIMTNEEMNGCADPEFSVIVIDATSPQVVVPAIVAMQKSGVIRETDAMIKRLVAKEAVPYWTWSQTDGLQLAIFDLPAEIIYRLNLYCSTETIQGSYPLYDTVVVEKVDLEEIQLQNE